jgi:ZIP family zinc transporter
MSRRFWSMAVVFVFLVAAGGGVVAMRGIAGTSSGEVTVDHVTLRPGEIVLTLESHPDEVVTIAQAIVNDAYVDFEAGGGGPRAADVVIHYPWIKGESYEIELLTPTGASIDYEIEEAGAS